MRSARAIASICCSPPLKRSRLLATPLLKARKEAEYALEILAHFLPIAAHIGAEAQVLLDGQIGERAAPVRHVRDAETGDVLRRQVADRPPAEANVARAANEPAERSQDRGLAGAVGAEQGRRAAILDREIDPAQRPRLPVPGFEALDVQNRRAQPALPR